MNKMNIVDIGELDLFGSNLLSWPVHDSSTKMIYKNITIYECNGADVNTMTLLNKAIYAFSDSYLTKNITSSVDIILHHLDPDIFFFPDAQAEPCAFDMVSKCLEKTDDMSIVEACETTMLPIFVTSVNKNGHLVKHLYKNMFCIICGQKLENVSKIEMPLLNAPRHFRDIYIKFDFTDGKLSLRPGPRGNGRPAWSAMDCHLDSQDWIKALHSFGLGENRGQHIQS